jgi:glutamyl/glutaminyl-tRNA synthetase
LLRSSGARQVVPTTTANYVYLCRGSLKIDLQYLVDPTKDKAYLDTLSPQEREDFLAQHSKFTIRYDKTEREEILTYQQNMDYLDDDQKSERVWKFRRIVAHEGPLTFFTAVEDVVMRR